jgi:type IV pilus assembly protein PilA
MNTPRRTSNTVIFVVIAIVLVIAAIGVFFWRSHQVVNRVDKALTGADAAKVTVMEAATVHGGLVNIKSDDLGYNPAASSNPYLANIAIADGGRITVTTKDTGAQPELTLLLTPRQENKNGNAPIRWDCSVVVGDPDEAPLNCRQGDATPAPTSSLSPATAATISSP